MFINTESDIEQDVNPDEVLFALLEYLQLARLNSDKGAENAADVCHFKALLISGEIPNELIEMHWEKKTNILLLKP